MSIKTPALTVDAIIIEDGCVLLIKRGHPPFQGEWALPGGFVDLDESCESAVVREVLEETGIEAEITALVGVYSDPARDPRRHTVSVAYLCKKRGGEVCGADDASDAAFHMLEKLPELAFDHARIISDALKLI